MKIVNGHRYWSEAYQRFIIVMKHGLFEGTNHPYAFDTSGILLQAKDFVPATL